MPLAFFGLHPDQFLSLSDQSHSFPPPHSSIRQGSAENDTVLVGGVLTFTNLHTSIHIQQNPPITRRRRIKKPNVEIIEPGCRTPVNPSQAIAGSVLTDAGSTDGLIHQVRTRSSLTGPPTGCYLDVG
jgi:hypothetical protein